MKRNVRPVCMVTIAKMSADATTIRRAMHKAESVYVIRAGAAKLAQIHAPRDTTAWVIRTFDLFFIVSESSNANGFCFFECNLFRLQGAMPRCGLRQ